MACDLLMLTGGNDVDPFAYGLPRGQGEKDVDVDRDTIEIEVTRAMHASGKAVLGICRGMQLMAAAFGGDLIGDLPAAGYQGHLQEEKETEEVHGIVADPGSAASHALGGASGVNSLHHQAVGSPGPLFKATAWSPDGVMEALEAPGMLGIQWHPERLLARDDRHLAPFAWLLSNR